MSQSADDLGQTDPGILAPDVAAPNSDAELQVDVSTTQRLDSWTLEGPSCL